MRITESIFKSIRAPQQFTELRGVPGISWSAPIKLPTPIRVFGKTCTHITLNKHGVIRFIVPKANGRNQFLYGDKHLPESIDKAKDGFLFIPWGDLQRLNGCGVSIKLYQVGSVVIIDFMTKCEYNSRLKYMYQVQFDVRQPNIITAHYYHCLSGYNTFIGVVEKPDTFAEFGLKENQPYSKKALRFDTNLDAGDEEVAEEESLPELPPQPQSPDAPSPAPDPLDGGGRWVNLCVGEDALNEYRTQCRAK